jgi:hypothetical protein
MTKFHDERKTLTKLVDDPIPDKNGLILTPFHAATPNWQSPFNPDGRTLRHGVESADVLRPAYNRRSRRANGQTRPRNRMRGVALYEADKPWRPKDEAANA